MKYGLSETELKFILDQVVKPLKATGSKVYLFGSRANGKYKKFSDVDLLYIFESNQPAPLSLISQVTVKIEESDFPYKVDLVSDVELADSYRTSVNADKIEL